MKEIFKDKEVEAAILVDATNAFNSINREAMLRNIAVKCPEMNRYVQNCYGKPSELFIADGKQNGDKCILYSEEGIAQGDPVAMAMYALGLSALQSELKHEETNVKSVAYADDYVGAGNLQDLSKWWDNLTERRPCYGYYPNAVKSLLTVKPDKENVARELFNGTNIKITSTGACHLGATVGSEEFNEEYRYVKMKVEEMTMELKKLSKIGETEPHAAYAAFTHGWKHKWTYLSRTIADIGELMRPLENCIRHSFTSAIMNGHKFNDEERLILTLLPRLGGLGIPNPVTSADQEYNNSLKVTSALAERIITQDQWNDVDEQNIQEIKSKISKERCITQENCLKEILPNLSGQMKQKLTMAQETGASNWLSALPIRAKGFSLNKQEFTDALALRYGWIVKGLPEVFACGENFDERHAMSCQKGGLISIRHDEIRDITCSLLKEVCSDVTKEPLLQPLQGEKFNYKIAKVEQEARVDIGARGFWNRGQKSFFDLRVFNLLAPCYSRSSLDASHAMNERDKIRKYSERIINVEHGVLRKLKHIFPNTYQRIKSICSPAKGGTGCYRFNYQPGS